MEVTISPQRTLLLRIDHGQKIELAKILGVALGSGLSLRLFDAVKRWRQKRQREPLELHARILDDGDQIRKELMEDNRGLRHERDIAVERAHQAEVRLAKLETHEEILRGRLHRKDEQNKALIAQLVQAGMIPVVYNPTPVALPEVKS